MKYLFLAAMLFLACGVYAGGFKTGGLDAFETSVKTKSEAVRASVNAAVSSYKASINSKMSSWDSQASGMLSNFGSSMTSKFDSFESNFGNKLASADKTLQTALAESKSTSTGLSGLKDGTRAEVKGLSGAIASQTKVLKEAVVAATTPEQAASIAQETAAFDTAMEAAYDDLNNSTEPGGAIATAETALDAAVGNAVSASHAPVSGAIFANWMPQDNNWPKLVLPEGVYRAYIPPGLPAASNRPGGLYFAYDFPGSWEYLGWTNPVTLGGHSNATCYYARISADASGWAGVYFEYIGPPGTSVSTLPESPYDASKSQAGGNTSGGGGGSNSSNVSNPDDPESDVNQDVTDESTKSDYKTGSPSLDKLFDKLSPNLTSFSNISSSDYSLHVPLNTAVGDFSFDLGGWSTAAGGSLDTFRGYLRTISKFVFSLLFVLACIKALRQW